MSKKVNRFVSRCARYSDKDECVGHYHGVCGSCVFQEFVTLKRYVKPWCHVQLTLF